VKKYFLSFLTFVFSFFVMIPLGARHAKIQEPDMVIAVPVKKMHRSLGAVIPDFDEKKFYKGRRATAESLVQKAAAYFKKNGEVRAFNAFTYGKEFKQGEMYMFVYDMNGVCVAIGAHRELLWQNMHVVRNIINKANKLKSPFT